MNTKISFEFHSIFVKVVALSTACHCSRIYGNCATMCVYVVSYYDNDHTNML